MLLLTVLLCGVRSKGKSDEEKDFAAEVKKSGAFFSSIVGLASGWSMLRCRCSSLRLLAIAHLIDQFSTHRA